METANWRTFYEDGKGYHRTARGGVRRPEVFTPSIIQNISGMAIEKYFMAIFMQRGTLPRNHTMGDLIADSRALFDLDERTVATLERMDSLQNICSLSAYSVTPPEPEDVPLFLAALDAVAAIADRELASEADRGT